jgi:hypothetical protein
LLPALSFHFSGEHFLMAKRQFYDERMRNVISQECAKIIVEEGIKDFARAKRKAITRLGISHRALLPSNNEIERAIVEHQRLFIPVQHAEHLRILRETAVKAMQLLAPFRPRLVGPVLNGTAGLHSEINLHLFADTSETVMFFLMEHQIPFETSQRRLRFNNNDYIEIPVLSFNAGETAIDLTIFNEHTERESPRSPIDGKAMRRATVAEVLDLMDSGAC